MYKMGNEWKNQTNTGYKSPAQVFEEMILKKIKN